jgi:hypothetical protein
MVNDGGAPIPSGQVTLASAIFYHGGKNLAMSIK